MVDETQTAASSMAPETRIRIWENLASECFRSACPKGEPIYHGMLSLANVALNNANYWRRQNTKVLSTKDSDNAQLPPEIEKRFAHVEVS